MTAMLARIRENECVGCTKCIQACPVDAIIGSHQLLHTVIKIECIGCGLCVPPCPVDCIDMAAIPQSLYNPELAKKRSKARKERLAHEQVSVQLPTDTKAAILASVARAKAKRAEQNGSNDNRKNL